MQVTAAELLSWLSGFCTGAAQGHMYCSLVPTNKSVLDCAHDLSNHSQWPSAQANEATSRWFKNTSALFIGDSTIQNKAYYLYNLLGVQSACRPGTTGVCMADARRLPCVWSTNRSDFDLVVWNLGLHHLHLEPSRHLIHPPLTFTEYLSTLRSCAAKLRSSFPKAKLVYKMTNNICTSKYTDRYARDAANLAAQTEDIMYNMQFTDIGVQSLHVAERVVASEFNYSLMDPLVRGHCDCTGTSDGVHYAFLIPQFVHRLYLLHQYSSVAWRGVLLNEAR